MQSDDADYRFLTSPQASLSVRRCRNDRGDSELQLFGNRSGLLSLANVLLWFLANSWRREFFALSELEFVQMNGSLSLLLRLTDEDPVGYYGNVVQLDNHEQLEWVLSQEELQRVGLSLHSLASNPAHEYDRLHLSEDSPVEIHIRLTDINKWI